MAMNLKSQILATKRLEPPVASKGDAKKGGQKSSLFWDLWPSAKLISYHTKLKCQSAKNTPEKKASRGEKKIV
jgi:hypothetical protein